ncbi:uncharacterized protein LOC143790555 [Ranitomeya variabilis]|uniref:uncharacterized protein LOC143790555 n=1 Tax=Ranitomeya variabilis TaxID=490064 RepID=UPI004055DC94
MWSAALQVEVSTISDPLSEDLPYKRIFLIYPAKMDMDRDKMAEKILHLTLEILFRLTGEDYTAVKKTFSERCQDPVSEGCRRPLSPITGPPPYPLIHEDINDQKILELTYKMNELLTEEVPIRCQDVAVYFSMEEWEYLEGHKDLYKDVIMEIPQPLTSPDLSSKRTIPERCPRPRLPQDCKQEDPNVPQDHQSEDLTHINTTETCVRGDEWCKEEIPTCDYPDGSSVKNPSDCEIDYLALSVFEATGASLFPSLAASLVAKAMVAWAVVLTTTIQDTNLPPEAMNLTNQIAQAGDFVVNASIDAANCAAHAAAYAVSIRRACGSEIGEQILLPSVL